MDEQIPENIVELINELLIQSFGKGFNGNYANAKSYTCRGTHLIKTNYLGVIFKSEGSGYEAGFFTKPDGSALKVRKAFEEDVLKYAAFYKKKFGKKVEYELF